MYITGSRSDFGLTTPLLTMLERDLAFDLHIYATGMHLLKEYGMTLKKVKELFPHVETIDASFPHTDLASTTIFGSNLMKALTKKLILRKPDLAIIHGDRPEALVTAITCRYLNVPIAHIHGGDKTTTVDDAARHAITQMASLHFPATKRAARRIERMGVEKKNIHIVGALGLDALRNARLKSRRVLEQIYGLPSNKKFILVVQHPISEDVEGAGRQMSVTLQAVKNFQLPVVLVYPNGDPGSKEMIAYIRKEEKNTNFHIFPSVDYATFATLEKEAAVWVGNSSAGIVESTYFKTPVVNIGPRQDGRERSANIIDVDYDKNQIFDAIQKSLYDKRYLQSIQFLKSPWGDGKAAERIMKVLKHLKYGED